MVVLHDVGWGVVWLGWMLYCGGIIPMWLVIYVGGRPRRSRLHAWAVASLIATIWPVFLLMARLGASHERRARARRLAEHKRVVSNLEAELRTVR